MKRNASESYVARSILRLEISAGGIAIDQQRQQQRRMVGRRCPTGIAPSIAGRSSPSTTSTTKRAKCDSGSQSSTDGGNKNPVSRSISRKLLIEGPLIGGSESVKLNLLMRARRLKSDRLLDGRFAIVG